MNKKIMGMLVFIFIIGAGLVTNQSLAYNDQLYLGFDFSGLDNGDEKAILLVDVPYTGGMATRYVLYEVENSGSADDWWLYEYGFHHQPTEVYLEWFDYIIVINSNSDGTGGADDFNFKIRINDDGTDTYSEILVFGDDAYHKHEIAIFQIRDNTDCMTFGNDGEPIAYWLYGDGTGQEDPFNYNEYPEGSWQYIWGYLDDYYNSVSYNNNQHFVESLFLYYIFPKPYGTVI